MAAIKVETTFELFDALVNDNLSFIYEGDFDDVITERVIDISETYIAESRISKLRKKVSFLMVECFQNIIRHGQRTQLGYADKLGRGMFMTRNVGDVQFIASANLVQNSSIPELEEKIHQVNNLAPDALKQLYFMVLNNDEMSQKGGAGLGLIEMARKSGQKLDYAFAEVTSEYSNFYLQLKITQAKTKGEAEEVVEGIPLSEAKNFHEFISLNNISIVQAGALSREMVRTILIMIEQNMKIQEAQKLNQKAAFQALVEVLQNISQHSLEQHKGAKAIIMIGEEAGHFMISIGNTVTMEQKEKLTVLINVLNSCSKEELNKLYRSSLKGESVANYPTQGMGLIEIARRSTETIKFGFRDASDGNFMFVISIKV